MSEHKKPEVGIGQLNLDEGMGDEYQLKSEGNLSEENQIHEIKDNAGDPKITNLTFIVAKQNNYEINSYVHNNDQPIVLETHESDQSIVPEDDGNTHHVASRDFYNKDNVSVDHEQDEGVVSGDDDNNTVAEDHKHDVGLLSGDEYNNLIGKNYEHDNGLLSGDEYNNLTGKNYEHDNGLLSGDNGIDIVAEDHGHDDSLLSGDDGSDLIGEDHQHGDGVVSENDDNDTVAEDHDSINADEEDISISIKNKFFSCIGRKAKNKDKTPYQTLTYDKEKQLLIDPFRQTQWTLLKTTPTHPPIETMKGCGVINAGVIGSSNDTVMQSGKTNHGNIHTGNIHFEDSRGRGHLVNNRDVAYNCTDPDQYDFSHPHRGYAVLIVNRHFSRLDVRKGAEVDVQNTTMVLQKLGFFINQFLDLDKDSVLAVLRDAKDANHSRMDCFAFIISSHGNEIENPRNRKKEHAIYCSDDQYIFTNDILEMFSDENCPSLKGKPKLFFIQACRGTKIDSGIEITVYGSNRQQEHNNVHNRGRSLLHHGKNIDRVPLEPVKNAESDPHLLSVDDNDAKRFGDILDDNPIVHCNNDCLVMYAIPSGYFAWRSNVGGSWMLHYLWEEVKNYNLQTPCSFLKVLTTVNRKMSFRETIVPSSDKRSGKKAIPVIIHQLDKDIVFQEKHRNILNIQS